MEQLTAEAVAQSATPSKTKITLSALRPKTQLPVVFRPLEKGNGKLFTGQGRHGIYESLSKEEKDALPYVIDRSTQVRVSDGHVLDLDDPIDAANWEWMKLHPYLAVSKEAANSSEDAVFYVNDPEKDAVLRVSSSVDRDTARYKVHGLSHAQMQDAARVMGLSGAPQFSADYLKGWLLDQAEVSPKSLLIAIDPSYANRNRAKVLFNEAMRYQIFSKSRKGTIDFGGTEMGHNEDTVLEWLLDPSHGETIKVIAQRVNEAKGKV